MELLVLGANGLLGSNVVAEATSRGLSVTATYHTEPPALNVDFRQLDIRDTGDFADLCAGVEPDAVVNCAAMTDVDGCEHKPSRAESVNGQAPGQLAGVAADSGASFVQVSTDYVFDGERDAPYPEDAEPNPIQVYGRSKLLGERTVRDSHPAPLIPRLSFVYGRQAGTGELEGFPAWVRSRLSGGESIPAFVDQHVTPTRAGHAAGAILDLLDSGAAGVVHVACRTCCTPYEIARMIAEAEGYSPELVERGRLSDVDRPAARPAHTCLEVGLVEQLLDRDQPVLADDLDAVL